VTHPEKLKEIVAASGLKKSYIAERLNLSRSGYLKKESGKTEFVASEIQELSKILSLSRAQVNDIFLS
jgi:transcriptional regulator with XRE-family HTH domain